jgi:hypothetical protein
MRGMNSSETNLYNTELCNYSVEPTRRDGDKELAPKAAAHTKYSTSQPSTPRHNICNTLTS